MFECLKRKVKAKIIIQFIKNVKKPKYIEILKYKKEIGKYIEIVDIDFTDLSLSEYKIYKCKTQYEDKIENNSISIYYNRTNYIQCGDGKHSVEIIFSNFLSKEIRAEECYIEYDDIKYIPIEDFGLSTRKRINFLNVDINKFKFPKDINNNTIKINTKDNKNFLVSISLINRPKIIAVYPNNPFIEKQFNYTEKEINDFLDSSLNKIKKYVFVKDNENMETYFQRYKNNKDDIVKNYMEEMKNSYETEKKISEYFVVPREQLNQEQIRIYEKYADFMAYFPKLYLDSPLEKDKTRICILYRQYYYSYNSLKNFYKTFPDNINESDKVKLKYSAARCLRTLLNRGDGLKNSKLFDCIDFTAENTVYKDAIEYNKKFIDSLTEKSEIFLFFIQINSGISINLLNNEFMSRISMLDENKIKKHLYENIPKYGIRLYCDPKFYGCTFNEVKITCINEMSLLGFYIDNDSILSSSDDSYNTRFLLANLMQYENFGHIKFSDNLSPFKYYMIKDKKEQIQEIVEEVKNYENNNDKQNTKEKQKEENGDIFVNLKVTIENTKNNKKEITISKELEKKEKIKLKEKCVMREEVKKEPMDSIRKNEEKKQKKEDSKKPKKITKEMLLIEKKEVREEVKKEPMDSKKKNEEKKEVREDEKRPIYIKKKDEKSKIVIIDRTKEKEKKVQKDKTKDKDKICLKDKIKDKDKIVLKELTVKKEKKDKNIEKEINDENIIKGESGIALSFFLTRGKYKLMKLLSKKGINFKKLFDNPELQASEDLTTYIQILSDIYMLNSKLFEEDFDDDVGCGIRSKKSRLYSNYKPYGIPTVEKFA